MTGSHEKGIGGGGGLLIAHMPTGRSHFVREGAQEQREQWGRKLENGPTVVPAVLKC